MPRRTTALLSAITVLLLPVGCGPSSGDGSTDVKATARQSGEGSGASDLVLVDVRVSAAEGFDRIVLQFSGTGTPGWVVNYVDETVLDGSGDPVDLGGRATLDIYVGGTFEGTTQVLAGIDGAPVPFRVSTLTAPSRLVVDVMNDVGEDAG